MKFIVFFIFIFIASTYPPSAEAGNGHEECSPCHSVHNAQGSLLFPRQLNTQTINPYTGESLGKRDALCMSCHAPKPEGEGIRALDLTRKHYFGGNPKIVKLPPEAVRGRNERGHVFTCLSCHDPHPANKNYCYLRTDKDLKISEKAGVKNFCLWCHPNLKFFLSTIY
ncbi:MAG: hypothetical protein ACMUJM_06655 [bacterium]